MAVDDNVISRDDSVQAVRRCVRLLETLAAHSGGLSLRDASKHANLPPSTAHRLLLTLAQDDLVTALPGGHFDLGAGMARLGAIAVSRLRPSVALHDLISNASIATGETVGLLQLTNDVATVVDKVESTHPLRYHLGIGTQVPLHCTASGKVLLAHAADDVRSAVLSQALGAVTSHTITGRASLDEELRRIVERGYAVDDQEFQDGLYCVAMPVRDYSGQVVYALAISGPAQRFQEKSVPALLKLLKSTVRSMEAALGFAV